MQQPGRVVDFDQVIRAVSIETVLARYGVRENFRRCGHQRLRGSCPIHNGSNKDQFVVDLTDHTWRCYSPQCDAGGDVIAFVARMEGGLAYREAALRIADWYGLLKLQPATKRTTPMANDKSGNAPSFRIFSVRGEGDDAYWLRLGSAWWHKDKKGLNLVLDALPVDARLVLREPVPDEEKEDPKPRKGRRPD